MDTRAGIDTEQPRDLRLTGTRTITVDGGGRAIVVRTEVTETFDHCSLAAAITVDGRPYFDRPWDLELRQAQWRLAER